MDIISAAILKLNPDVKITASKDLPDEKWVKRTVAFYFVPLQDVATVVAEWVVDEVKGLYGDFEMTRDSDVLCDLFEVEKVKVSFNTTVSVEEEVCVMTKEAAEALKNTDHMERKYGIKLSA